MSCQTTLFLADIPGAHHRTNISLSLQLCRRWLIEMGQWSSDEQLVTNSNTKPTNGTSLFTEIPAEFKNGMYLASIVK